jgi:hypothetical protein
VLLVQSLPSKWNDEVNVKLVLLVQSLPSKWNDLMLN